MLNPFNKRPGATLIIIIAGIYACIIGGWAGFVILAKSRKTTQLNHEEATQLYKESQARKADLKAKEPKKTPPTPHDS